MWNVCRSQTKINDLSEYVYYQLTPAIFKIWNVRCKTLDYIINNMQEKNITKNKIYQTNSLGMCYSQVPGLSETLSH
jgi:hypothetical protein